ncbi:Alpha/Beta hydrolase protein [Armillaria luteobubalina]|uniref:Alpha/Beta hydrolase protein n=1 Tax=Armillaria luteobubalina TaxID=153913 RepID=A0AA39TZ54_9AGAR|nr:Alpha/Beta hydrolase protein [Armillaria luteobubalina]
MKDDAYSTIVYKMIGDLKLHFDLYHPRLEAHPQSTKVPAVVYFHGGGLTVGNRKSWFPYWLCKRLNAAGIALVCADYRLIPSGSTTAYEILQDIKDLFTFLPAKDFNTSGVVSYQIDRDVMGVAGTSSGGLCAYLAAIHAYPRPRAVLSMYGMGGNFFTSHYFTLKTAPFFRGRELLDPSNFTDHIFPTSATSFPIADSPLEYHSLTSPTPGYPANPRMLLARLYLQLGTFLDYYTGAHEPSLSATLCTRAPPIAIDELTLKHKILFPQMNVTGAWPPTLFVHGAIDTAVPADESRHLHYLLLDAGVNSELVVIDGMEHSFDYAPESEEKFGTLFDSIAIFFRDKLNANIGPPIGAVDVASFAERYTELYRAYREPNVFRNDEIRRLAGPNNIASRQT